VIFCWLATDLPGLSAAWRFFIRRFRRSRLGVSGKYRAVIEKYRENTASLDITEIRSSIPSAICWPARRFLDRFPIGLARSLAFFLLTKLFY
jgi:hypothetical protein